MILATLREARVLPVLTLDDESTGLAMAAAMARGGLRTLEITLRTPRALSVLAAIAGELPELCIGAGSVRNPEQLAASARAGARFVVSPGISPALLEAAKSLAIPLLPGIATASELMLAVESGFNCVKFFPAESCGGIGMLRQLSGPFPEARFCPTGGLDGRRAAEYLAQPAVVCVGGSWMIDRDAVDRGDWIGIERAALAASRLRQSTHAGPG